MTPTVNSSDFVNLSFFFFFLVFSQKLRGRVTRNIEKKHMALVREHLISSQFFSKRNAFRNGGRGLRYFRMENHKSHIFHTKGKLILKKISKFGSSASVRLCHCSNPGRSTRRGDRP